MWHSSDKIVFRRMASAPAFRAWHRILAVEVLSPSDSTSEVIAKIEMYQEAGIPLIRVVDPQKTTITVIAAGRPTMVLKPGDILEGGDVLPGFTVAMTEIFG